MKIDLGDFFTSQQSVFPLDLSFSPDDANATGMIPADMKIKEDGIVISGEIRSVGDYLSLVSIVTVRYGALCDRCLSPFDGELTFEFDRQIVASQKRGIALNKDGEEELLAVEEGKIDLTEPLSEAIALEAPTVHLCRVDCPGLCPKCGKMRDDPTCKCAEKKEIDPRLEILKKILDKSDEV
ncbi:MAG: DUF177 domain-containing protein [Clostridia bacterium]|nr:DUF177 domain-containing protein [Clostridia bacterium]